MTQFSYGSYTHAENEVRVVRYRLAHEYVGNRNNALARIVTLNIEGELQPDPAAGDKHADLVTKMAAMRSAYDLDGGDILFTGNSSNTIYQIDNSATLTGNKVLYFEEIDKTGAEYASCKHYTAALQSDIALNDTTDLTYQIAEFQESLTQVGSSAVYRIPVISLRGVLIFHEVIRALPIRVIQQGFVTGFLGYPRVIPDPTWPDFEDFRLRRIVKVSPRKIKRTPRWPTLYTIRYRYYFTLPYETNLEVNLDYPLFGSEVP